MMDTGIPLDLLNGVINWYSILHGHVKRDGAMEADFDIKKPGIGRQYCIATLFCLYINDLMKEVRLQSKGCCIR